MQYDEAKQRILVHAGFALSADLVGFFGRLRPYSGVEEKDFADCLVSIHPTVSQQVRVDRELCAALWSLCERTRVLTAEPQGTLRANRLITEADLARLRAWTDAIEVFAVRLLSGLDLAHCISHVAQYLSQARPRDPVNFRFLLPILADLQHHEEEDIRSIAADTIASLRTAG